MDDCPSINCAKCGRLFVSIYNHKSIEQNSINKLCDKCFGDFIDRSSSYETWVLLRYQDMHELANKIIEEWADGKE